MRMVIQLDFCCPFCIPDATMHSTYRVDSRLPLPNLLLLRHLHGHCVVCYTVQRWLVFVVIISVET